VLALVRFTPILNNSNSGPEKVEHATREIRQWMEKTRECRLFCGVLMDFVDSPNFPNLTHLTLDFEPDDVGLFRSLMRVLPTSCSKIQFLCFWVDFTSGDEDFLGAFIFQLWITSSECVWTFAAAVHPTTMQAAQLVYTAANRNMADRGISFTNLIDEYTEMMKRLLADVNQSIWIKLLQMLFHAPSSSCNCL
jgi:hypothetical protein